MKKIVLMIVMACLLLIPVTSFAEEEVKQDNDNRVKVYLFRGETCPHCQEAEAWLDSINEQYGEKYVLVDYEVWYNEENAKLMEDVSTYRGDQATGVPYIIVGDKSWVGFDQEKMGPEITAQIDSEYAKPVSERYDVMKYVSGGAKKEEKNSSKDVIALLVILVVVGGICFGVYKAREAE